MSALRPVPGPAAAGHADLADAVAAAVRAVPGVAALHTGSFGEVATYLPGRRVPGIRLLEDRTEVHVVLAWGVPVLATADAVRAAVAPLVDASVDVTVEDVVDPLAGESAPGSRPPAGAAPNAPHAPHAPHAGSDPHAPQRKEIS